MHIGWTPLPMASLSLIPMARSETTLVMLVRAVSFKTPTDAGSIVAPRRLAEPTPWRQNYGAFVMGLLLPEILISVEVDASVVENFFH